MSLVRLQKYLSAAGICSRRSAEELILAGRISVNGKVVNRLGSKIDAGRDSVCLDGRPVFAEEKHWYLFYKPVHVISTLSDPQGRPCVGDYLRDLPVRVFTLGRLDWDASGLLLLTNDGDAANALLHPGNGVPRTYWAVVDGNMNDEVAERLVSGVDLDDGFGRARSCRLLRHSSELARVFRTSASANVSFVEVITVVGRKHFVKNILAEVGHPVRELCRVAFGRLRLGDLEPGELRRITGSVAAKVK